jgi:hypothetical protein
MVEFLFFLVASSADIALAKFGGLLVRVFGFGRWKVEPLGSRESQHKSPAGALSYTEGTTRVITHTGQLVFALVFWAALGVGIYAALP